jgi:molybdate transport system permease protein
MNGASLLDPLWLSVQLAAITSALLIVIGTPIAWWLAQSASRWKPVVQTAVAMPIVLPPTVMGFYLLIVLGPAGAIGRWWVELTGSALTFSFAGLVIASCIYSLPFAVQPLATAFESLGRRNLEAAWTLGASRLDAFFSVALPLSLRGYLGAAVLSFAHTLAHGGWQHTGRDSRDIDRDLRRGRVARLWGGAPAVRNTARVRVRRIADDVPR